MSHYQPAIMFILSLLLAPLLQGVINRTKAVFAGRRGPPLVQCYRDLWKLLHKGAVYSRTTTWVFRAGPIAGLAAVLVAASLSPAGAENSLWHFSGDFLVWIGCFALMRLFLILAALDTGSAFAGMGASREAWFSALAEPALFLSLAATTCLTGKTSLSVMFADLSDLAWTSIPTGLVFILLALFLIILAENCRIPVDDPNTHLELTMIHEAMILDHGGVDSAIALYGAYLKLWVMGGLAVQLAIPLKADNSPAEALAFLGGMAALGVAVGLVESGMARVRLTRVPQMLAVALALSALALMLLLRVE